MYSSRKEEMTKNFLDKYYEEGCGLHRVFSDSFKLNKSELKGVKWLYYGPERYYHSDPWEAHYLALLPKHMSDDKFQELMMGLGARYVTAVNLRTTWEQKQLEM